MIPFDYDLGSGGEQKQQADASHPPKGTEDNAFAALTDADLRAWAGVSTFARGTTYQRQGRVKQLARTTDGRLVA